MSDSLNQGIERRDLLKAGVIAGGVVVAGSALAGCAAAEEGAKEASATASIPLSTVAVGGGVVVADPPVVVTQPSSGDVKAFTAICPHAGCLVSEVADNVIICPCHGSKFSAEDGSVIAGPASSGLAGAAYKVDGDTVTFG